MSPQPHDEIEEHELPCIEAVLAGTLALMTGYSQALQAAAHPEQRLMMGRKITRQLELLAGHPQLSCGFRQVLMGLATRWQAMSDCTEAAAHDCAPVAARISSPTSHCFDAPTRLQ
jgi:hypothetical protein